MKRMNACVVGVGRLGGFHANKYIELEPEGVDLTALVDPRVDEIGKKFSGVPVYPTMKEFLAAEDSGEIPRCDLASIATPTEAHAEVALQFLGSERSVLIEKPMAQTVEQCRELLTVAERHKQKIAVGHVQRHLVKDAFAELSKPRFIECHRLAPFTNRSTDIDVVLDLMIHDIDLMIAIVKSPLRSVHAAGFPVLTNKVDIANARFEFENGCVANITSSRITAAPTRKFRVFTEDAYFSMDLAKGEYAHHRKVSDSSDLEEAIDSKIESFENKDPLLSEVRDFVDSVRESRSPLVSGEDALLAQEIAEKVLSEIDQRIQSERA